LPYASTHLAWWDVRQYVEDYWSGNVSLWRILRGLLYSIYYNLSQAGLGLGPAMRWLYDKFHPRWSATQFPRKTGFIPKGQPTPTATLNLKEGELVRVKPYEEILRTLNIAGRNRGLLFDAEMVPYCGGTYRVLNRINKIIVQDTGKIQELRNSCIVLDGVVCEARYSRCRMFCPRSISSFWREIWLERVAANISGPRESAPGSFGQSNSGKVSPSCSESE
jgi:hypothetical protein